MSEFVYLTDLLNSQISEAEFVYEMDKIESKKEYQYNWDRESRFMLENKFPDILLMENEKDNVNYITVTGRVGRGKSNVSLWLAKWCDSTFDLKSHLYLGKDTDLSLDYITQEHEKGQYIVIEEAEIMLSKYTSTSLQNRATKDTLDTVRDFGVNFIFNAPSLNSLDSHFVDWQVNFNIICSYNDKLKKYVEAFLEVNVSDKKLDKMGYIDHSNLIVPYVSKVFFNQYQKIKRDKLYNPPEYRKTFRDNYRSRVLREKQSLITDNLVEFMKLVNKTRFKKKRDTVRKQQIELAVKGLQLNVSKAKIKGILKISDGKINEAETQYLIKLKETRERERE